MNYTELNRAMICKALPRLVDTETP